MKKKKIAALLLAVTMTATTATGCGIRTFDTPEIVTIEPSQTAFLIDLTGDSNEQSAFESEELLAEAKVASKEIQIPHRWVDTERGFIFAKGEWRATQKLIIVERKPVTREWSADANTGTSNTNQAIYAESKESIGFSVAMNITAQIYDEDDAVKFLYEYNNVDLETVMDNEIRAKVETVWNELCAPLTMEEIRTTKSELMNSLRTEVTNYFKNKGVTITTLGLKEGITYENADIQSAIDRQIISEKNLVTAQNETKVKEEEAQGDANATIIRAEAEAEANKKIAESLTPELIEKIKYEQWNGVLPTVEGVSNPIIDMGTISSLEDSTKE